MLGCQRLIAAHRPKFAVYFSSTVGADYQVGMWAQYFDRIGMPYIYVVRSLAMMRTIGELTAAPVVFRPTLRSVEDVIVPGMTTSFYVNNAVRNTHFIERRELTHIWLNHGDSEKPACFNPVHAIYDKIYAAGQAGIDRYARHGVHIPLDKFEIVGRPQVELISPSRGPIAELSDKTVLYAPTWRGPYADSRVYSLPLGPQIVEAPARPRLSGGVPRAPVQRALPRGSSGHVGHRQSARGRPTQDRNRPRVGRSSTAGMDDRGLLQRLRRHGRRRLGGAVRLSEGRQALQHRVGRARRRSSCWTMPRWPERPTCYAMTCPT